MSNDIRDIPLDQIEFPEEIQPRVEDLNTDQVDDYAEALIRREPVPPIDVFEDEGRYVSPNGRHRWEAAKQIKHESIACCIRDGGLRAATKFALGANHDNGLPRSRADKVHQITMALTDPEWVVLSNREIARMCHVSHDTVLTIRRRLEKAGIIEPQEALTGADGRTRRSTGEIASSQKKPKKQKTVQDRKYQEIGRQVRQSVEQEKKRPKPKPQTQDEVQAAEAQRAIDIMRLFPHDGREGARRWPSITTSHARYMADWWAEFVAEREQEAVA